MFSSASRRIYVVIFRNRQPSILISDPMANGHPLAKIIRMQKAHLPTSLGQFLSMFWLKSMLKMDKQNIIEDENFVGNLKYPLNSIGIGPATNLGIRKRSCNLEIKEDYNLRERSNR
jgi:hypothetical protein